MASKYDGLSASRELEQAIAADLKAALEPRGCVVIHNGSATAPAPGGRPDIGILDPKNRRLIHVQVTKRKGAAADGEFIAVKDHLEKAIKAGGYDDYFCLFVSPATSTRMAATIRDLYNRARERDGKPGRVIAADFLTIETLTRKLTESDPALYPASRFGDLAQRWEDAADDARTRALVVQVILAEDAELAAALTEEMRKRDAEQERRLKQQIAHLENKFREHGITGPSANETLIYLTFMRLYEEKRQREQRKPSRFTLEGFASWKEELLEHVKASQRKQLVGASTLLEEIAEDKALKEAGLLWRDGQKDKLHAKLTDELVEEVLRVFDQYDFYRSPVDILGVVFETLARRGEKDTRIGQFFTPQEVVNFCADVADLGPTDVILDPAVGTARFLIAGMKRELAQASMVTGGAANAERAIRSKHLLGVDIDGWVATIAKMNMYIHGDGKTNISDGNGLSLADRAIFRDYAKGLTGKIDVVLTNPPLGDTNHRVATLHWKQRTKDAVTPAEEIEFLESLGTVQFREPSIGPAAKRVERISATIQKQDEDIESLLRGPASRERERKIAAAKRTRTATLQRLTDALNAARDESRPLRQPSGEVRKGGALFLGAIANYLKRERLPGAPIEWRGGRAVVVVDEAILNTQEYEDVRTFIRERYFVKAVVSLGRDAFKYLAHTDAKTSILFLVRKPADDLVQREPIFYGHAERVGYSAIGKWIGNDLPEVLGAFGAFKGAVLNSYNGAVFDSARAMAQIAELPEHKQKWQARLDAGKGSERLSYYYARYRDLADDLEASGVPVVNLGDLIVPRERKSPEASSLTGEYEFAVAERVGTIERKGRQDVKYPIGDLWTVEEGDIIISGIDVIWGAAGVAGPDVANLVMSKEMFAYRVRPDADVSAEYVALLLRTQQVRAMILGLVSGTSNRMRVSAAEEILGIPVPKPPSSPAQEEAVKIGREAAEYRRRAMEKLREATGLVSQRWPTAPKAKKVKGPKAY